MRGAIVKYHFSLELNKLNGRQVVTFVLFGLFWCWCWIVFESPTDLPVQLGDSDLVLQSRAIALAGFALVCCGVFIVTRMKKTPSWPKANGTIVAVIFAALAIVIGVVDAVDGSLDGTFLAIYAIPIGFLFGVFGALFYIEWGVFFGYAGIGKFGFVMLACVISSMAAALFGACMYWISDFARQCFVLCFPLISYLILTSKCIPVSSVRNAHPRDRGETASFSIPWKLGFTLLVLGLSLGIMQGIFTQTNTEEALRPVSAIGFAIAGCVALPAIYLLKLDFDKLMYQVGLPLMSIGFAVFALFANPFAGYVLSIAGYRFTELIMWILGLYLITKMPLSAYWVFALIGGMPAVGQAIGLASMDGRLTHYTLQLSIVAIVVILLSSLYLITSKTAQESWGLVSPGKAASHGDAFQAACIDLVDSCSLSVRETEVFMLLAQGRNKRNISNKLVLSENTIKTHISNIYQKLDVHSQQELIDRVESRQRQREREDPNQITAGHQSDTQEGTS